MVIQDNKIIEATENELYSYWLKQWSDLISFDEYIKKMKKNGVIIKEV